MTDVTLDALVIGAGAAGMASALALSKRGFSVALADRESFMGGILPQCIHPGFGLATFGEELTGPEFALRLERDVSAAGLPVYSATTVLSIEREGAAAGSFSGGSFTILLSSAEFGVFRVRSSSVVLAMGSRERNRGNIRIAGSRPAGVFTAGLVQRLINIEGFVPGKRAVIVGSGDIGLIMARRLTLSGMKVEAVVEIQPFPSGLTRNIVQCLDDFSIPLYLSHATLRILGNDRVSGIEIAPLEGGSVRQERAFTIPCDTVLLSVGLVPENELSSRAGIVLNPATGGPVVDSHLMTSVPGIFAAGNVLHIHDLVDNVVGEAERAGHECCRWLDGAGKGGAVRESALRAGTNVRYTVPSTIDPSMQVQLSLRSMVSINSAVLSIVRDDVTLFSKKLPFVRPGEMISLEIPALLQGASPENNGPIEVSLVPASGGQS